MLRPVDLIRKKRDGGELSREEIASIVNGYTSGAIPDYQASAWLMAVLLKGMTRPEIAALTEVMLRSGATTSGDELRAHMLARLNDWFAPRAVEVIEAFPLTEYGKIDKKALRDRYLQTVR